MEQNTDSRVAQMHQWIEQLNAASAAYYNGKEELMTDYEWDALFDRLKAMETLTGITLDGSPTAKVSEDNIAGKKEDHEFAALSLAKTKSPADLVKWAEERPIWMSWKLDGLTLVVTYDEGQLSKVVTRGNGHTGTNITHLAPAISDIPQHIDHQGHLVIRGEAVISYKDFEIFNMESDEEYANPRNLASGSLTLKDINEVSRRHIQWIAFTLVYTDEAIDSWGDRMALLDRLGFTTVERELITTPTLDNIDHSIDGWTHKVTSGECPFPVDGLVIVYDDTAYASTGSVTGHHATRAGYAFKWQDESAQTQLDHIEWSCAASTISPVAVFTPVSLEGTTVKRASLCNISECERLGIGGAGTEIEVIKANKIIPKVVAVTKTVGALEIPSACPVCGAPTEVRQAESGTKTLRCTNAACAARELRTFMRFVSKDGMDIDGLAGETLAKFVNRGWIKTFGDIYRLGDHAREIAAMEGFGEKSARNLQDAIEQARTRSAVQFLVALSIPLCGADVAKRLLGAYGVRDLFAKAAEAARSEGGGEDAFAAIDGIGPGKSAAFVDWCADSRHLAVVEDVLGQVTLENVAAPATAGACAGLTFVVTGEVHRFANRDALKAYVAAEGGKVTGSVSAKTDFLINNDVASTSGKNRKAKELGVPVISEDEFIARFGS